MTLGFIFWGVGGASLSLAGLFFCPTGDCAARRGHCAAMRFVGEAFATSSAAEIAEGGVNTDFVSSLVRIDNVILGEDEKRGSLFFALTGVGRFLQHYARKERPIASWLWTPASA